jgi:Domain of unknown function (DUF4189)
MGLAADIGLRGIVLGITWFSNGCGAFSAGSNGSWGGNWALNEQRAQALSLAHCAQQGGIDCEIKISHCSGG